MIFKFLKKIYRKPKMIDIIDSKKFLNELKKHENNIQKVLFNNYLQEMLKKHEIQEKIFKKNNNN